MSFAIALTRLPELGDGEFIQGCEQDEMATVGEPISYRPDGKYALLQALTIARASQICWEGYVHTGSVTRRAIDRQPTAMPFDDMLDDRQTQPGPA